MTRDQSSQRRAFTIVEAIVVVVIIAMLAGAIVPRLMSIGGREVRGCAQSVGDLVTVAARRDTLTSQRIAIEFDSDKGRLSLLTLTSAFDPSVTPEWREDMLVPHVDIGDTHMVEALADSVALDLKHWRIEFPQGSRRPALELVLSDRKSKEHWRVQLPSGASQAAVEPGDASRGVTDQSIDLDANGGGTSPW